jgi:hypothetical protein
MKEGKIKISLLGSILHYMSECIEAKKQKTTMTCWKKYFTTVKLWLTTVVMINGGTSLSKKQVLSFWGKKKIKYEQNTAPHFWESSEW